MRTKLSARLLSVLFLVCVARLASVPAQAASAPEELITVEVNGYAMAYQDSGEGTPLVLIHGGFNDYRTWEKQIPFFSKSYRTIAVSLRHHYPEKWDGVGNDYSVAQHASDVASLIKRLSLGKVHLLGHSRGGAVAFAVVKMHPELIRSIILEDGNVGSIIPETPETKEREAAWKKRAETARANLEAGNLEKAVQEWWDDYAGPGVWEKFPPLLKPNIIDNAWSAIDTGERGDITCEDVLKFNFPILLLNGEKSPKHYARIYSELRRCRPDFPDPIVVPNASHLMHSANPEFYNFTVLDFLDRH